GQYPWWTGSALMLSGVGGEQSRGIVDPRTGRLLINLENWNLAGVRGATPERISLWLTRFVSGRTDVALLEPSGWRRIGTLAFEAANCQAEGDLLACTQSDGRVGTWRANLG